MQRWVHNFLIRAGLVAAILVSASVVFSQQGTVITISESRSATPSNATVADVLRTGRQLELERRWGEALAHYEEAMRKYPNEPEIQQRFDSARLHYDLERRYIDRSFRESVLRMSTERALELYAQVLLKIESHYVDMPQWRTLVAYGTRNFDMALGEPTFVNQNVPPQSRQYLDLFRQELWSVSNAQPVVSRADARIAVANIARLARERLNINPTAVVFEYLCGATNALDTYSTYLTPDQLNELYAQIEGNFVGLGVELKSQNGELVIVRVIPGSPAEESGVRANDIILAIDRQPTKNFNTDQAANLLQGVEGSVVMLTLASPGQPPREITVRRRRVDVPSIDQVGIIDREYGVGYFKLTCFQKTTARDLDAALWQLHREGMRSLVIDLRGNPGGLLVAAVEVADRFIERGIIVSTHGRSVQEDFTYSAHEHGKWRMPLVVIIDQDSASAAEIFAGAIRDHRRGTIVGVRSFGKGSVQGIFPLDDSNAGVRLTTAKFYSPLGKPYSQVGVEPDITVNARTAARPVDGTLPPVEDVMLNIALQEAKRGLTQIQAGQPRIER